MPTRDGKDSQGWIQDYIKYITMFSIKDELIKDELKAEIPVVSSCNLY